MKWNMYRINGILMEYAVSGERVIVRRPKQQRELSFNLNGEDPFFVMHINAGTIAFAFGISATLDPRDSHGK